LCRQPDFDPETSMNASQSVLLPRAVLSLFVVAVLAGPALAQDPEKNTAGPAVINPRVVCDRWPAGYDAKSWITDVFRIENARTDEEKTIALYKWVRLVQHWGVQCGDGTRGQSAVECDAIKKINIFPYGECSDFGVTAAALGHAGGLKAMEAHVPGHVELEVAYKDADGTERWHRLDPFWGVTVYDNTGTRIATWEEIKADPNIARKPAKTLLPWGDKVQDRERFVEKGGSKPSLRVRPSLYTMDKALFPGETYALRWERNDKVAFYNNHPDPAYRGKQDTWGLPRFQYAGGKIENLKYGHELLAPHVEQGENGIQVMAGHGQLSFVPVLGPDYANSLYEPAQNVVVGGAGEAKLRPGKAGQPATLVFAVRCPYVLVGAQLAGSFRTGKGDSVKVSIAYADWRQRDYTLDQVLPAKPSWTTIWESKGAGSQTMKLDNVEQLRGEYQYLVKVEMTAAGDIKQVGVDALSFTHLFQQSQLTLPRLLPGKNVITVTAAEIRPGYQLKVVYSWDDAKGKNHQDVRRIDRVPFRYEITAAGSRPADVRTRSLTLEAVKSGSGE
jgi:hypothetical protein